MNLLKDGNKKAGMIPYHIDEDGVIRMLFMVASDPRFGGPKPMISKGDIEEGEDEKIAAIREAQEELGLRDDNMLHQPWKGWSGHVKLRSSEYDLTIYACQVASLKRSLFDKPHFETRFTVSMTQDRFHEIGRADHKPIVDHIITKIKEYHGIDRK